MANEREKIELKWYTLRPMRLTGEYVDGLVAGFGGGILVSVALMYSEIIRDYWGLIRLLGLVPMCIGVSGEFRLQDRYER